MTEESVSNESQSTETESVSDNANDDSNLLDTQKEPDTFLSDDEQSEESSGDDKETKEESKEEESKENEESKEEDKKEEESKIPESYTLDGGGEFDDTFMNIMQPELKSANINNEQFNSFANAMTAYAEKRNSEMKEETKADPDFQGKDFKPKIAIANSAIKQYGGSKLLDVLVSAGVANNVEIIRAFHKIGKTINEDGAPIKGSVPKSNIDMAQIMYPNETKRK
ncbi:hypothetical protein BJAS_P3447 [Bathymodiolus japonicus methanotrophic gill symbiont]|uniref:hypothetical protein n=1 Tax=Bathymodiolus japonicus methanotrophic gill symbiont TaxID=113269 RepID=UPI001B441C0D|nr:hypothetical protein [Bathymodiolus japonicus methanotrophic gill symbiont]GFO72910.1 hypothetical protein BJAS_P3447 [Bathymodiolus japonicus methanotrophic gill symbiont]